MHKSVYTSLHDNETVKLEIRQNFWSNFFSFPQLLMVSLGFLISFLLVVYFMSTASELNNGSCTINGNQQPFAVCYEFFKKFMFIGFVPFVVLLFIQVYLWILPLVTEYVVTDKRVILKSGLIGADVRSVLYNQIRSVTVKVGLIDRMFGTGVVMIDSGDQTLEHLKPNAHLTQFSHIDNPYEVAKMIQESMHKIQ